jgi:hypothetical protein
MLLLVVYMLIYSSGMIYVGLRTLIIPQVRYFLPMLPLYLLFLGTCANWSIPPTCGRARKALASALLVIFVGGYIGTGLRELAAPCAPARHEILASLYAQPTADGQPLLKWVESHLRANDPIVAADGQATGYLLQRPTIGMPNSDYTLVRWECQEVARLMRQFGAGYLIVYKPDPRANDDWLLTQSRFIASSASGKPSCGFDIAAENSGVLVLARGSATW